jgi:GNAT superfamily N-acetyltransferase
MEIRLLSVPPQDPVAIGLLEDLRSEIVARQAEADPGAPARKSAAEALLGDREVLVAFSGDEPVGLGALVELGPGTAEIKRMYVVPAQRATGVGRLLLGELERRARGHEYARLRLDTHDRLTEANALYRSMGYREIGDYNGNPRANRWYEKPLGRK